MMTIEEMNLRRSRIGATYQQICFESGIPLSTVQKVLGKVTPNPRMSTMLRLEQAIISLEQQYTNRNQRNLKSDSRKDARSDTYRYDTGQNPTGSEGFVREPAPVYGAEKGSARASSGMDLHIYTARERDALPSDRRTELIDGVLYDMAAPSVAHQTISRMLLVQLDQCIRDHHSECRVYDAPVDVYLDRDEYTVVMPDIVVVCDQKKITWKNIQGAPDFIIEILSPSTMRRDEFTKLAKYAQAGVREYWLVNPVSRKVVVYDLRAGEAWLQQEKDREKEREREKEKEKEKDKNNHTEILPLPASEEEAPSDGAVAYETSTYDFNAKIPVKISGGLCTIDMAPIQQEMDRLWGR